MTTPDIPPVSPTPAPLADWGTRALGFLIDAIPSLLLGAIFRNYLAGLVGIGYTVLLGHLDGVTGQTPGKAMMGIRLVDASGAVIGSGAGIGRKFVRYIDWFVCGLGNLLPLVDANRQTIADKLMSTYVVTGVEKKPFAVDLWLPPKST